MSYQVEVTREDGTWIADVLNVPGAHTHAGNLPVLIARVREVIGLVLDIPDVDEQDLDLTFIDLDDSFVAATKLGAERETLERKQREVAARTEQSAMELSRAGWSVRDISGALRVTPGRVSQLVNSR